MYKYINKINNIKDRIHQLIGKRSLLLKNIENLKNQENEIVYKLDKTIKAKELLELFVKSTELQIKQYIEPTVTEALTFIFNQNLYFHIVFLNRRGQIEVDFIVLPNYEVEKRYVECIEDPIKYEEELDILIKGYSDLGFLYGGAVQEILGLVLRLLLVELLGIKGPVFLDEPTSATHEEYASRVGIFIRSLSEKFKRQIIYVTHSHAMASAANKVYFIKRDNEISVVEEM